MQYSSISELYSKAISNMRSPPVGCILPWMPKITEYLGGLRPHEVTLLCAPTGTGKTELLATIAAQLTISGTPTFVAPVETGGIDFVSRTISTIARKNLNHGLKIPDDELDAIERSHGERIKTLPLLVANYDNRVDIGELKDVLETANKMDGAQVALLDNLNFFLDVKRSGDLLLEMDNAIHDIVMFSKRIAMHTILIVHPKKTDHGRVESEFDIKGSSTAVQECANVALFNRPTSEQLERGHHWNHRELVFKKIRKRGFYTNKPIWLSYQDGHYTEVVRDAKINDRGFKKDRQSLSTGDSELLL